MKEIFIRLDKCLACKTCEIACAVEHSVSKSLFGAIFEKPIPRKRLYVEHAEGRRVPILCRNCEPAPCLDACLSGAVYRENNVVMLREERCTGCWMCIMLCPYGVVGRRREERIAVKCDLCPEQETPVCVESCPTKALVYTEAEDFARMIRKEAAATLARSVEGS
jgi:carbon-monoxide dehydrogenase iron sulfur subunit